MSFHGQDIGAQAPTNDESVSLPWETIEPEEADREPQPLATSVVAANELSSRAPLRVAVEPPAVATFSAAAPPVFSRDSQGFGVSAPASRDEYRFRVQAGGRSRANSHLLNPDTPNPELLPNPACGVLDPEASDRREPSQTGPSLAPSRGGGWTIPLVCLGIGLIACCAIIPQADANRRLAYQKELLQRDLESIQKQVSVNDEFLKRVYDDGSLAERLAQRQMNVVPAGNRVWRDDRGNDAQSMSPYGLTIVPKPEPLPPYQPTGGQFAALCRDPRTNLYLTGAALMMLAAGLVMGMAQGRNGE